MRKIFLMMIVLLIMSVQNFCGAVEISNERSPFHENIFYPLVHMQDATIEKKINGAIIAEIDRFVTAVYRNAQTNDFQVADLRTNFEIPCNEAGNTVILSVVITESNYFSGAAHPSTYCKTLSFNLASGELMDIGYLTEVGEGVSVDKFKEQLELKLQETAKRGGIYLFPDALPLKKLPENFYWDKNLHVHFIFNHYEVAPYAAGIIDVDIEG